MTNPIENICCQNIDEISVKLNDLDTIPPCITLHEAFQPAILNKYTLRIAYLAFAYEFGSINEINRWTENE